jgi:hypothetical protein
LATSGKGAVRRNGETTMSTRNGSALSLTPSQAHERYGEDSLDAEFRSTHGRVGEVRKVLADKARSIRKAQNALDAIDYLRCGGVSLDASLNDAVGAILQFRF